MSLSQVSDVVFLIVLPSCCGGSATAWTIAIGILAWARYFLLAGSVSVLSNAQMALIFGRDTFARRLLRLPVHRGQLYVDDEANERIRAAQGLIAFILWGVGASSAPGSPDRYAGRTSSTPSGGIEHDWPTSGSSAGRDRGAGRVPALLPGTPEGSPSGRADRAAGGGPAVNHSAYRVGMAQILVEARPGGGEPGPGRMHRPRGGTGLPARGIAGVPESRLD